MNLSIRTFDSMTALLDDSRSTAWFSWGFQNKVEKFAGLLTRDWVGKYHFDGIVSFGAGNARQ